MSFFLFGCAGSIKLNPDVCEIGLIAFEVSETLCNSYEIPSEICFYIRLASLNFNILCSADPESNEYQKAKIEFIKWCSHINDSLNLNPEIKFLPDSLNLGN